MKYCLKTLAYITAFSSLLLIFTTTSFAADFDAHYNVLYDILKDGTTKVTQEVTFINQTKNRFATRYTISIGSDKVANIRARDSGGEIKPEIVNQEGTTQIQLSFNDRIVGLGKELKFSISYENKDVAMSNGTLWEVTIPKLATEENVTQYSLQMRVPKDFGPVHYMTPKPSKVDETDKKVYNFSQEDLFKNGISAAFGSGQTFELSLKYHLYNPNIFGSETEIALPPDTAYQQVNYLSIDPRPREVYADPDGNYMARYSLDPGAKVDVVAKLRIHTLNNDQKFATKDWNENELASYLTPNRYWETQHPAIISKAKELKGAEEIFNFVSNNLKYGYDRLKESKIERLGAVTALSNPELAICMEYTDLTIALLRAAGIPARELNGYAYTQNEKLRPVSIGGDEKSDILHAWVEYYDKDKGYWVQIDPTWTSTTGGVDYFNKLDNNHLVFVIKGLSSESPYPAGSYKYADTQQKDIDVFFAKESTLPEPDLEVSLKDKTVISGFGDNTTIEVVNNTGRGYVNIKVKINSADTDLISQKIEDVDVLPPFAKANIDVKIREAKLFTDRDEEVSILIDGQSGLDSIIKEIKEILNIQPFYVYARLPILLISVPLILLASIMILIKTFIKNLKIPRSTPPQTLG